MKTYDKLSRIPFLKKYSFKFLFVAFLGIHIPLIGLIIYLAFGGNEVLNPMSVFVAVLIFTLLATAATLYILNRLLEPIIFARDSLSDYINHKTKPNIPTHYTDEMGILLKEIQFSVKTLDELINEKQDMIGLMSHDLKNPLTAIMTYSEMIPAADTDEKKQKLKEKIIDASKVQRSIINSVLELLEREEIIITEEMMEVIEVQSLLEEAKSTYEGELDSKNLTLEIIANGQKIRANKDLISQVITNLLSNSIKFTPNGGNITLIAEENNDLSSIRIVDNGIGFKPEKANLLFERFTKEKRKGTEGENTTGLGLYLCEKIVSRHNGSISAISKGEGTGATFEMKLPSVN